MRTVQRLKKTKRNFTPDLFYIYVVNGVYQFRDSKSHMVISTSFSEEGIRECIDIVLRRYKNYDSYLKAVNSLSESSMTAKDKEKREKEYKKNGQEYNYIIEESIDKYYENYNQAKEVKKTRCLVHSVTNVEASIKPLSPTNSPAVTLHRKKRKSRL